MAFGEHLEHRRPTIGFFGTRSLGNRLPKPVLTTMHCRHSNSGKYWPETEMTGPNSLPGNSDSEVRGS